MRDAEELWGRPRGCGENEDESRRCEGVGELLKSWGPYLGKLGKHNLERIFPVVLLGRKRKETDVY